MFGSRPKSHDFLASPPGVASLLGWRNHDTNPENGSAADIAPKTSEVGFALFIQISMSALQWVERAFLPISRVYECSSFYTGTENTWQ